jgi:methyl-accepting chemotaxis protein
MRFTIKMKLAAAFGTLILLLAGVAGFGVYNLGALNDAITEVIAGPAKRLELAMAAETDMLKVVRAQKNLVLATTAEERTRNEAAGDQARDDLTKRLAEGEAISSAENKGSWRKMQDMHKEFTAADNRVRELVRAGDQAAASALSADVGRKIADQLSEELAGAVQRNQERMVEADEATNQQYAETRNLTVGVTLFALLAAVGAALWIALGINRGLTRLIQVAEAVAIGDLDQNIEIKTNDEIKDLVETFNGMTETCATPPRSPTDRRWRPDHQAQAAVRQGHPWPGAPVG